MQRVYKAYLRDGVYVTLDGEDLVLTAEDGIHVLHRIVLEPETLELLEGHIRRLLQALGRREGT